MRSTEVYRVLNARIGPWCKAAGFRRTKGGMLGWVRPQDALQLVFWFQCSRHGWDPYAGSQFTLEFQLADHPEPGRGRSRKRFFGLLTAEEREALRAHQNQVIAGLTRPATTHWSEQLDARARGWYLGQFESVKEPYGAQQDVWLRYGGEADVIRWADFLLPCLPRMLVEFETRMADQAKRGA